MSGHNFKVYPSNDKPRPRKPLLSKPKQWSHQDDLRALKGKRVALTLVNGNIFSGVLLEADQFTIKLLADDTKSVVTYYKHILASFSAE